MEHRSQPLPDRRGVALRLTGAAAVLALLGLALASLPGLGDVRDRLAGASVGWLTGALALELGSCLAFVLAFRGVFGARLAWRRSYDIGMAVQGTNVLVPTGGASGLAVGAWALRRSGVGTGDLAARTVAFFLVTSAVNFLTTLLAGLGLALGVLTGDVALALTLGPAAVAGAAIVAVLLLPRLRLSPGRGRFGLACSRLATALGDGVLEARRLVGSGSVAVLAGAFGYMALDVAALAAAFAAIGSVPPIGILALGYALGQLGGLIPLPGGIGGADTGVVGALVLYGVALPEATAAVLAYRAFQLGLPAVLGAIALLRLPRALGAAPAGDPQGLARPLAEPVLAA